MTIDRARVITMLTARVPRNRLALGTALACLFTLAGATSAHAGDDIYIKLWNRGAQPLSIWTADVRGSDWKELLRQDVPPATSKTDQVYKLYHFWVADGSRMEFEVKCKTAKSPSGAICAKGRVHVNETYKVIPRGPKDKLESTLETPGCPDCYATVRLSQHDVEVVIDPDRKTWQ